MRCLNEKILTKLYILLCTCLVLILAIIQPINCGPDEVMKMDICKFVADYGKLPHGGDERVINKDWGISYGFTPILSYIVAGVFIKVTSFFTNNAHSFYVAARLVSVICYFIMTIFVVKIAKKLFKKKYFEWLFIIMITLLPQVVFIGSYINNDSLALMSIAIIIYYWISGFENKWRIKDCIGLGISLGICALSYYNAYGYILTSAILFLIYGIINKLKIKEILKKGLVIVSIAFLICGWWFIRSAIIYNGDFLGLKTTNEYSNKYAIDSLKADNRLTPHKEGISFINMLINKRWIVSTFKSFIGVFGGMTIFVNRKIYILALGIILIGILGYVLRFLNENGFKNDKNRLLLDIVFLLNIIISIALSMYYSYFSDFQPQGRYIMPSLIPLMYFVTLGIENLLEKYLKNEKIIKIIELLLTLSIIFILVICVTSIIKTYIFS